MCWILQFEGVLIDFAQTLVYEMTLLAGMFPTKCFVIGVPRAVRIPQKTLESLDVCTSKSPPTGGGCAPSPRSRVLVAGVHDVFLVVFRLISSLKSSSESAQGRQFDSIVALNSMEIGHTRQVPGEAIQDKGRSRNESEENGSPSPIMQSV